MGTPHHTHLHALLLPLALCAASCLDESTATEVVMVQPGTTTRELGPLAFTEPSRGDNLLEGDPPPFTRCSMAKNAGSIALIEIVSHDRVILTEDCKGPYSGAVAIYTAQVYGVAAGEALPSEVELVYHTSLGLGGSLIPEVGAVWLATVRQARGEWFLTRELAVALGTDGSINAPRPPETSALEGFPSDFHALSDLLIEDVNHLATRCPKEAEARWSDEHFRDFYCDPTARPGSNCHPDDGPQQQNSSEMDEEDLPPSGGTDDSVQP